MRLTQLALALAVATGTWGFCHEVRAEGPKLRVGTFDSRAVAVAYAGSEGFGRTIQRLREELKEAKGVGDEEKAKKLEKEGEALQERLHQQGFSTASVANLLAQIKDQIPGIAREAGVDVIVSKWDIAYQSPSAELVDITELLIKPFHPNEKAMKSIKMLEKHAPVPLEELKNHKCR